MDLPEYEFKYAAQTNPVVRYGAYVPYNQKLYGLDNLWKNGVFTAPTGIFSPTTYSRKILFHFIFNLVFLKLCLNVLKAGMYEFNFGISISTNYKDIWISFKKGNDRSKRILVDLFNQFNKIACLKEISNLAKCFSIFEFEKIVLPFFAFLSFFDEFWGFKCRQRQRGYQSMIF